VTCAWRSVNKRRNGASDVAIAEMGEFGRLAEHEALTVHIVSAERP